MPTGISKGKGVKIIVMLFPGQYDKAPRLQRECYVLSKAGYNIHIIDIKDDTAEPQKVKLENVILHPIALPNFAYEKTGNVHTQLVNVVERLLHYLFFYISASFDLFRLSREYRVVCPILYFIEHFAYGLGLLVETVYFRRISQ